MYQTFVEWSAVPIHKNLVAKGKLMIIKDFWRFGDQVWNKAVSATSESNSYSLLFGILEIAQSLIISTKNISNLAHCYYLAKLSLDLE